MSKSKMSKIGGCNGSDSSVVSNDIVEWWMNIHLAIY